MANVWAVSCGGATQWNNVWPHWVENEYVAIGNYVNFPLKVNNIRLTDVEIFTGLINNLPDDRLRHVDLRNIRDNYRKFNYIDETQNSEAKEFIERFVAGTNITLQSNDLKEKIEEINGIIKTVNIIYSRVNSTQEFAYKILENDFLIIKSGNNNVLGAAKITGEIAFSNELLPNNYNLFRKVKWIKTLQKPVHVEIPQFAQKAVQDLQVQCDPDNICNIIDGNENNRNRMQTILTTLGLLEKVEMPSTNEEKNMQPTCPLNQILFGPPGTGKTYNTVNKAIAIANPSFKIEVTEEDSTRKQIKTEFDGLINSGQVVFTTFHQSMSYEDFIEGIKPLTPEKDDAFVKYDVKDGIFKQICDNATKDKDKNFVLIIDEINRGNVSQIFGELITLIEDDKRLGKDEALKVTLPYSKEEFGVPSNLYIIGTMNTADRSVEALDAALRRRFSFEEMQPKSDLISTEGKLSKTKGILESDEFDEIDLPLLLNKINERIEKLLDKDHQIGHSYFMSVASLDDLKLAVQNKIIPLLQEYFFGDYGKIGLVLGKGFVSKDDSNKNNFAAFSDTDADEFSERPIFKIINPTSNEDFIKAIESLLSNKKTNGE